MLILVDQIQLNFMLSTLSFMLPFLNFWSMKRKSSVKYKVEKWLKSILENQVIFLSTIKRVLIKNHWKCKENEQIQMQRNMKNLLNLNSSLLVTRKKFFQININYCNRLNAVHH